MGGVIVTNPPKADAADVEALGGFGVATVSEAMGRTGLLSPQIRPVQQGVRMVGTAVTVLSWPGDNLMIHAAVEQCGEGDVLVVTTTSPSTDGMFGELFATALQQRGVRGLITNAGVRDTQELRDMDFPAWARAVSAQGTVKATGGSVNVPVAIDGQVIRPGDVILADDDGVVVVPRERARAAALASEAREAKEARTRAAFLDGELGLDRYGLRDTLKRLGVEYRTYEEHQGDEGRAGREGSEGRAGREGSEGRAGERS
ncbi:4-carboxy-4-hydroxy-2-oxoadipate aldolase/oxaloacetate decarboxylase [Streptomyces sp. NBC_01275]|uniref:4-carboxy-4-hydroxy-2-oxoadipate aldolase/oxaloacetate decarboxylase n=1 Tax=Streptomyces sp. NBC_01275 TaxID=2903807 RepID=UPI00225696F5|nr:4-carboxy-4-hydroxy-2-oxoadipate aldolase/oxaloacetate decarboxylase [Streptomyces sp. NBC_01275]MCX4766509.1 4-carboxy-4-hydroxy-2-oxoadipate aldolase/oxaloacetate decarboxylase [Streptomyces sp. NBC_01275]